MLVTRRFQPALKSNSTGRCWTSTAAREGRIYLRRPNRFRIELEGGDVVVASDGEAVWSYVVHNGQVVVSPYEAEIKTPWEVFFDYTERYVPIAVEESALRGRSCYLLIMAPENKASVVEQMRGLGGSEEVVFVASGAARGQWQSHRVRAQGSPRQQEDR